MRSACLGMLLAALPLSAATISITGSAGLGGNDLVTDLAGELTQIHLSLDSGLGERGCMIGVPCTLTKSGAGGNPSDTTSVYGMYAGQPISSSTPAQAVLDFVAPATFGRETGNFAIPVDVFGDIFVGAPESPIDLRLLAHGEERVTVFSVNGDVAGVFLREANFEGTLSQVPEPSGIGLLGSGILAVGLVRRCRPSRTRRT